MGIGYLCRPGKLKFLFQKSSLKLFFKNQDGRSRRLVFLQATQAAKIKFKPEKKIMFDSKSIFFLSL